MVKSKAKIVGIACIIGLIIVAGATAYTLATSHEYMETGRYTNLGVEEFERGNYGLAIQYFTKAIELNPDNALAYYNRGLAYLKKGDKYTPEGEASLENAISDFNRAIELKPDYVEAYYHRGVARIEFIHFYDSPFTLIQKERFDKALNDFNKTIELDGTFYLAYAGMGNAYDRYGEFNEAIKWYNKAIENEDKILQKWGKKALADIYYSRGRAYLRVENPQAVQDFETALKYNPNHETTLGHLSSLYLQIGRPDDALKLYNRCVLLKENSENLSIWDFHTWEGRGECYYRLGEHDKAIQDLNKAIEVGRRPILPAYLYLGKTYLAMGDDTKAREYFKKVIEISSGAIDKINKSEKVWMYPDQDYALYDMRGLAYLELGEYDKAISDFGKVIELCPDKFPIGHTYYPVEGRKNMGTAYLKMGNKEKATLYYQEALSIAEGRGLSFSKKEIGESLQQLSNK